MTRTSIWLNGDHTKQLAALGKPTGQRPSHLIRVAIAEFISRERRKAVAQTIIPGRAKRQAVAE
jgi:predicted transcriptional regulator